MFVSLLVIGLLGCVVSADKACHPDSGNALAYGRSIGPSNAPPMVEVWDPVMLPLMLERSDPANLKFYSTKSIPLTHKNQQQPTHCSSLKQKRTSPQRYHRTEGFNVSLRKHRLNS
ncbi:hypothetical protein KIN20_031248 [Parelaphostrongylus tenuis]|uniref:Uncharacterized protein n=1 Tax=Parelaphostrongylus tenuis TaxID=148309 RepID=A0AAD5R5B6_PARTN|nr:hypothetical protein KIN20_031248 [Parelaphostrongylus tenuis]